MFNGEEETPNDSGLSFKEEHDFGKSGIVQIKGIANIEKHYRKTISRGIKNQIKIPWEDTCKLRTHAV